MPATPPTPTTRGIPAGKRLTDGFSSLITFALSPTLGFWEKVVKPPGLDGGEAVDTTTMHNLTNRTFAPRFLKTMTAATSTVAYDPAALTAIQTQINKFDTVTITFPNKSSVCFYGFLQSFEPADLVEGTQPEATVTITPTNMDAQGFEAGWVFTPPPTVLAALGPDALLGEAA